ncbi:MAG: rhodanese-like domain-containing protein [Sphingobacteriaceae bacterium]|nr:MAG: rhodanese-like domain-containing protein [Sphingobacteriaceae bacterium]
MKKFTLIAIFTFFISALIHFQTKAQTSPNPMPILGLGNPWTETQVIEPHVLASIINNPKFSQPLIFNIGAVSDIKNAKHIGAVSEAQNMKNLSSAVHLFPKNTSIVIYCGCCPFNKCPNIRPAFKALQKEGFINIKVLDLPVNLKVDWSSKGYPLADTK